MRISDWSSDVYSSDLDGCRCRLARAARSRAGGEARRRPVRRADRLAQTLFRVAAFFDPFRGKRIGGIDVLREVDFLPFEPFARPGADAVALRDDVDRAQIPEFNPVGGAHHLVDRKSVGSGKSVEVRLDLGGRRTVTKKN